MTNTTPVLPASWRLDHPRTRLAVLHLWDGRCGHCSTSLLTSDEVEGIVEEPFEVDHIKPRSHKGPDSIANYLASCWSCNNTRRDAPITDARTLRRIAFIRRFIASDDFPYYVRDIVDTFERAIPDHAHFLLARCFDHQWHVVGSPFQKLCHSHCQKSFRGYLNDEWWSRFGSYSTWVKNVVGENLHIRGIVRGYDWWAQPQGLQLMLPRYCETPFDVVDVLNTMDSLSARPATEPAPMWEFSGFHTLSTSGQRRALAMAETAAAASLAANQDLIDHNILSPALRRLWSEKRWATGDLIYYHDAARIIQTPGQLRGHLRALRALSTSGQCQEYLRRLSDPDGCAN